MFSFAKSRVPATAAGSRSVLPPSNGYSRRHKADLSLVLVTMMLVLFGLIVIYAVSPILSHKLADDVTRNYFMYSQLRNIAVALVAFVVASRLHWSKWRHQLLPVLVVAAVISLILTFIPGIAITEKGATRWIGLGVFSFQPAELVKLTVVIATAAWFANLNQVQLGKLKHTLWPMLILLSLLSLFVLIHQKDMGSMVVISAIVLAVYFMSGASFSGLGVLFGAGLGFGLVNILLFPHRLERLQTFMNPSDNLGDTGYHLHQALIAIGSGGFLGLGLGRSVQVHGYLPEAANDSIFAIIGEMFGFLGTVAVLVLFSVLIYRMLRVAKQAPDDFSQLLVVGVVAWLSIQAVVNMMAMLGIIPLTGIPLPFVSYGGSSLVFMMIALGIVVNISRYTVRKTYEDSSNGRRQRRTYNATFSRLQRPEVSK